MAVRFVLAAAPAAPMPLRLALAVGRARPHFGLGLGRFCCHACTSWHFTVGCIAISAQPITGETELPLRPSILMGELDPLPSFACGKAVKTHCTGILSNNSFTSVCR